MDCPSGKFSDYISSRFGFIVQTDRQIESHTAHVTPDGMFNYMHAHMSSSYRWSEWFRLCFFLCSDSDTLQHLINCIINIISIIFLFYIIVIIVIDFEMENIEKHVLSTENLINAYRYQNEELLWNPDLNAKRVKRTDVDEA